MKVGTWCYTVHPLWKNKYVRLHFWGVKCHCKSQQYICNECLTPKIFLITLSSVLKAQKLYFLYLTMVAWPSKHEILHSTNLYFDTKVQCRKHLPYSGSIRVSLYLVLDTGFQIPSFRYRVLDTEFQIPGFRYRVSDTGF